MLEWTDLKYFLAVARSGSTLKAAKAVGVSQSTVHRRLAELERRIGLRLVHRHPTGYRLTEIGQTLLPAAASVEDAMSAFQRQAQSVKSELVGVVRLTCPEPIVPRILESGLIESFQARHPGLRIEFVTSDQYLDITKGEADIALRSGEPSDDRLIGRKIAVSTWAVYASKAYIERRGRPSATSDLGAHSLIGFEGSMQHHRAMLWLTDTLGEMSFVGKANSVLGVLNLVRAGLGIGALPTTIADSEETLVQVLPPVPELARAWYLLCHPELRTAPRVAAFIDFASEQIALLRKILSG
jgi:DNA-binding transcriptional LysR family regulator